METLRGIGAFISCCCIFFSVCAIVEYLKPREKFTGRIEHLFQESTPGLSAQFDCGAKGDGPDQVLEGFKYFQKNPGELMKWVQIVEKRGCIKHLETKTLTARR